MKTTLNLDIMKLDRLRGGLVTVWFYLKIKLSLIQNVMQNGASELVNFFLTLVHFFTKKARKRQSISVLTHYMAFTKSDNIFFSPLIIITFYRWGNSSTKVRKQYFEQGPLFESALIHSFLS